MTTQILSLAEDREKINILLKDEGYQIAGLITGVYIALKKESDIKVVSDTTIDLGTK